MRGHKRSSGKDSENPLSAGQINLSPWTNLPSPTTTPVTEAPRRRASKVSWFERTAALLILLLISPVMLLIALAIKLDSPRGPVLFKQERVGLNRRRRRATGNSITPVRERRASDSTGQPIEIFKFRTMIPDAQKATGPVWAQEKDPRVTRVGGVLRQLRLDELPQLFNVVRGQMRLIGPRPERPHFVSQLVQEIPDYAERHQVHPGITGLAQVEKHYDASVQDVKTKLHYDLFYAKHRGRLMDLKIIFKTIDVMIRGKGAR